jgi:D-alanyl-D-alanine carboxypeptidase
MKKLIFLLFFPTLSFAQIDSTDIIVKQMMEKQKIVGLSLAVIKNGNPIVNKGYGLANVELMYPLRPKQ